MQQSVWQLGWNITREFFTSLTSKSLFTNAFKRDVLPHSLSPTTVSLYRSTEHAQGALAVTLWGFNNTLLILCCKTKEKNLIQRYNCLVGADLISSEREVNCTVTDTQMASAILTNQRGLNTRHPIITLGLRNHLRVTVSQIPPCNYVKTADRMACSINTKLAFHCFCAS